MLKQRSFICVEALVPVSTSTLFGFALLTVTRETDRCGGYIVIWKISNCNITPGTTFDRVPLPPCQLVCCCTIWHGVPPNPSPTRPGCCCKVCRFSVMFTWNTRFTTLKKKRKNSEPRMGGCVTPPPPLDLGCCFKGGGVTLLHTFSRLFRLLLQGGSKRVVPGVM